MQGQLLVESSGANSREYAYLNGQPIAAWYTDSVTPAPTSISIKVSAGSDDAEERSTGAIKRGSKNLKIVEHQSVSGTTGIRIRNIAVPQGAQITNAYLQLTARRGNSGSASFTIQAEDIGNAPAITTTAFDITNRTGTTASVAWNPGAWVQDDAGVEQKTSDLSVVVQEIVDRLDWNSGNSMLFTINGTGIRRAHAYNSNSVLAPELVIEYTTGTQQPTEAEYYYHNDHLGTPQAMTDENQLVVWQADYKPFGEVSITTATIENNLRFPGQYYDQESGLNYNYYRDYDPSIGRYITSDPIGLRGGINTYAYVGGNPVNRIDPFGLFSPNDGFPPVPIPNYAPLPSASSASSCKAKAENFLSRVFSNPGMSLK